MGAVRIWARRARGNLSAYFSNSLGTQKQFNNEAFTKTNKQQKKRKQKKKKPCACFSSNRNHMGIYWEKQELVAFCYYSIYHTVMEGSNLWSLLGKPDRYRDKCPCHNRIYIIHVIIDHCVICPIIHLIIWWDECKANAHVIYWCTPAGSHWSSSPATCPQQHRA